MPGNAHYDKFELRQFIFIMKCIHIITPVKDSIELTLQTAEAILKSDFTVPFHYTIYNDFSTDENTKQLKEASLKMGFVLLLNHSFTKRIRGLSKVFQSVNDEHLVQMAHEDGRDEIGSMIRNYNRMVKRTNELIQTVYKNKIKEQEISFSSYLVIVSNR